MADLRAAAYHEGFYRHMSSVADRSAQHAVPILIELLKPASVVDVGCGAGTWAAEFLRRGIEDVVGVDGPWVAIETLEIPRDRFVRADLSLPLAMNRRYDLALSLETAEHLPPEAADVFVRSLTTLAPVVVFSAAIPHQGGTHHVNEQWPAYWAELFNQQGYVLFDCLRPRLWQQSEVEDRYAQNMLLFVHRQHLAAQPTLAERLQPTSAEALSIIHPRKYLRLVELLAAAQDLEQRPLSELLQVTPRLLARAVRRRAARFFGAG